MMGLGRSLKAACVRTCCHSALHMTSLQMYLGCSANRHRESLRVSRRHILGMVALAEALKQKKLNQIEAFFLF